LLTAAVFRDRCLPLAFSIVQSDNHAEADILSRSNRRRAVFRVDRWR
jgi:hypothetical protein